METLRAAYAMAKQNDAAPGIEGVTFAAIEARNVEALLEQLRDDVRLGGTTGETARLGLRGQWSIPGSYGELWQPLRGNLWRDWRGRATTTFGIDTAPLVEQATRLEFAGGVTVSVGPQLGFYPQAGY